MKDPRSDHERMFAFMSHPSFRPCADCGASVARDEGDKHECDEERKLDYQLLQLRYEIAGFDDALGEYLDSPAGRFNAWYAERRRRPLQES
jgi:hypothetical protein